MAFRHGFSGNNLSSGTSVLQLLLTVFLLQEGVISVSAFKLHPLHDDHDHHVEPIDQRIVFDPTYNHVVRPKPMRTLNRKAREEFEDEEEVLSQSFVKIVVCNAFPSSEPVSFAVAARPDPKTRKTSWEKLDYGTCMEYPLAHSEKFMFWYPTLKKQVIFPEKASVLNNRPVIALTKDADTILSFQLPTTQDKDKTQLVLADGYSPREIGDMEKLSKAQRVPYHDVLLRLEDHLRPEMSFSRQYIGGMPLPLNHVYTFKANTYNAVLEDVRGRMVLDAIENLELKRGSSYVAMRIGLGWHHDSRTKKDVVEDVFGGEGESLELPKGKPNFPQKLVVFEIGPGIQRGP